jgi:hypothetical protein
MTDHRDFEEPFAAPDATTNEPSTRWILLICFTILILAGLAFASVGQINQAITNAAWLTSDRAQERPATPTIIVPESAPAASRAE